jgi:hypothetical protein
VSRRLWGSRSWRRWTLAWSLDNIPLPRLHFHNEGSGSYLDLSLSDGHSDPILSLTFSPGAPWWGIDWYDFARTKGAFVGFNLSPLPRPSGDALVATGGVCAPSAAAWQPWATYYPIVSAERSPDLPTVTVQRGGIRFGP